MSGENRVAMLKLVSGGATAPAPINTVEQAMRVLASNNITMTFGNDSVSTTQGHEVFFEDFAWDIPLAVEELARQVRGS